MLEFLKKHPNEWVHNQDLRDASGINDVARQIRAFRQLGWQIEVRGDAYVKLLSLEKGSPKGIRSGLSNKVRYEILSRDGFRCRACGQAVTNGAKLQIDHKIPVDWGGTNQIDNLETLCEECNAGKKAWTKTTPTEKMREIMFEQTVEKRIEALFDNFPNQEIPSSLVQLVSKGAFDWQRALRKLRQNTGKMIIPTQSRKGYIYKKS